MVYCATEGCSETEGEGLQNSDQTSNAKMELVRACVLTGPNKYWTERWTGHHGVERSSVISATLYDGNSQGKINSSHFFLLWGVAAFPEKSLTKVYGSTLLVVQHY